MNIKPRLTETVTWAALTGRNSVGEPTFGSQASIKARVQRKPLLVRGPDGAEVQSETQVFTDTKVSADDRIWLPEDSAADVDKARKPVAVAEHRDLAGQVVYYLAYF